MHNPHWHNPSQEQERRGFHHGRTIGRDHGDPLSFHLHLHLDKEDAHLYRLMRERVPIPDQANALGQMAGHVPQERFPEVVAWMFPLMGHDDREKMTRAWQMGMPAPVFAGMKSLIRQAIGEDWAELVRRIPTLA